VIEQRRQNLARKELAWLRRGAPARTSKPKFRIDAANVLIEDVPEIRDKVSLQSLPSRASARTSSTFWMPGSPTATATCSADVEWRIAPGAHRHPRRQRRRQVDAPRARRRHRQPTSGRVKRGTTVKVATLTQRMDELEEH
jgi:hypothetical protein